MKDTKKMINGIEEQGRSGGEDSRVTGLMRLLEGVGMGKIWTMLN